MRVIVGGRCVCGVVGLVCSPSAGGVDCVSFRLVNDLGWLTGVRESRVGGRRHMVWVGARVARGSGNLV